MCRSTHLSLAYIPPSCSLLSLSPPLLPFPSFFPSPPSSSPSLTLYSVFPQDIFSLLCLNLCTKDKHTHTSVNRAKLTAIRCTFQLINEVCTLIEVTLLCQVAGGCSSALGGIEVSSVGRKETYEVHLVLMDLCLSRKFGTRLL